jgi:hypothetical protein
MPAQRARSGAATLWLLFLGALLVPLALAICNPAGAVSAGQWQTRDAVTLASLVSLLVAAALMHGLDRREWMGFKALHDEDPKTLVNLDDSVVSGMLTVQSVRAAMTVGMLGMFINWQVKAAQSPFQPPVQWGPLLKTPSAVFLGLVAIALAVSAMTTLAALLCYDYSLRFDWTTKSRVKLALRRKAHKLGVWGFYCLMWSLCAATALIDSAICIVAIASVYVVMWYYYFFPTNTLDTLIATTLPAESVSNDEVTLAGIADTRGDVKATVYFEWGRTNAYGSRVAAARSGVNGNVTARLTGLAQRTEYHFRVVTGTWKGEDLTFTTGPAPRGPEWEYKIYEWSAAARETQLSNLKIAGSAGWEAVAVVPGDHTVVLYKRPKPA